jgi:hypothetical protein
MNLPDNGSRCICTVPLRVLYIYVVRKQFVNEENTRIFLTPRETLRLLEIMKNPPPRTEKFIQAMDEYQKSKLDDNDTSIDWSSERNK